MFKDSSHVLCFSHHVLTNLSKIHGTRYNEITKTTESKTLLEFFQDSSLWFERACVLLGSDNTSGAGKSVTAMVLAMVQSEHMCKRAGTSTDNACVLKLNTPEDVRNVPVSLRSLAAVVFDEFKPSNLNQAKFVDEDILKIWFDVRYGGEYRANYNNGSFPPGVPRTFTANADSVETWLGIRHSDSHPILRRIWVFVYPDGQTTVNMEKLQDEVKVWQKKHGLDSEEAKAELTSRFAEFA